MWLTIPIWSFWRCLETSLKHFSSCEIKSKADTRVLGVIKLCFGWMNCVTTSDFVSEGIAALLRRFLVWVRRSVLKDTNSWHESDRKRKTKTKQIISWLFSTILKCYTLWKTLVYWLNIYKVFTIQLITSFSPD